MSKSVIAAQLFTLREFTRTPAEIAVTVKKLREIGYEAAQASALGPIEPKELRSIVVGEGLVICATHVDFERLRDDTASMIEEHQILGCEHAAIGSMPVEYRESAEGFARFAREAEAVGRKLADAGMTFSYHNHNFEFERFDGRPAMDIIFGESDPRYVKAELDTYWVQAGGGDPAAWIDRLHNRIVLLHLKDMAMKGREPMFAEIGEGNLNWPEILKAARSAEVKWYIVEQDRCLRDPFESLKISLDNLRAMGLR